MRFFQNVRGQRKIVEVDLKSTSTFARAITQNQVVQTHIKQVVNHTDHNALLKVLQNTVRPYAIALVTQLDEGKQ